MLLLEIIFEMTDVRRRLLFLLIICCSFSNLGNTCYMNAILQALFALVPFSTDLLNVTDTLVADSSSSSSLPVANNQRLVSVMMTTIL